MKKAHFICEQVLEISRTVSPAAGKSLSKSGGGKFETIIFTVTLISSGNTSKIKTCDIVGSIINKLSEVR